MRSRRWIALALGFWLPTAAVAAKHYVATPEVEWEALVPYIRASIVPELEGDQLQVFICDAHTDRSVVTPFDEALADFTRVLVIQAMRSDRKVVAGIDSVTERFRQRLPELGAGDRVRYRELFWQSLSTSGDVLPRIELLFRSARDEGKLRCWGCDKDPGFAPRARRIRGR